MAGRQPHWNSGRCQGLAVFLMLVLSLATLVTLLALGRNAPGVQTLDWGWEYRWGDSPVRPPREGWTPAAMTTFIPGRNGASFLWMRVRLPRFEKMLSLRLGISNRYEVYGEKGELVFQEGNLDTPEGRRPAGWGRHFVDVPPALSETFIAVRIFSDSDGIGFAISPRLGERSAIVMEEVREEATRLMVAIVLLTIGGFSLLVYLRKNDELQYRAFALLALSSGVYVLMRCRVVAEILVGDALLTQRLELLSLYLMPVGYSFFVVRTFLPDLLHRTLGFLFLAYWAGVILASLLGVHIHYTLSPFQLMALVATPLSCLDCLRVALRGDREASLYVVGILCSLVFNTVEILISRRILTTEVVVFHWGFFGMILALGMILVLRYVDTHMRVLAYSRELECKNDELLRAQRLLRLANESTQAMAAVPGVQEALEVALRAIAQPLPVSGFRGVVEVPRLDLSWMARPFCCEKQGTEVAVVWGSEAKTPPPELVLASVGPDGAGRLCISARLAGQEGARIRLEWEANQADKALLGFLETIAESLAAVLAARHASDARLAEVEKRKEAEARILVKTVAIAANVSDRLNSPLLVLQNSVEGFTRRLKAWKAHNPGGNGDEVVAHWTNIHHNFNRSFSSLKQLSIDLSEIRDEGASIEATAAMEARSDSRFRK